ncbi:hypothetical protein M2282_002394 [Variovorax boronicumulans]|uniref:hypothetical protein n=1 Tax=Variovorax boronicumulans TaxID=436515 RepID=UPI00247666BD|nr:hypothetical protein [Variovorax boronicumulans]MDH6167245.1 hypothetical protein [Variovorax boronicumulans]
MKTKSLKGCAQPLWIAATVLAAGVAVTGCGGGGGGGGVGFPLPPVAPAAPAATAPAPAPPSAPSTPPNRDPVPGSEPLPSLSAPQAGSTAAVGNDSEGIYVSLLDLALVGADGAIASKDHIGTLWGSIKVTGLDWSFNPDTAYYFIDASPVTGSGTFTPKKTMKGTYVYGKREPSAFGPLTYATENALAVSQDSVVGKWANPDSNFGVGLSIEVDATGAFTGKTAGVQVGNCSISGVLAQAQPGTSKNMYGFKLSAADASTDGKDACKLKTDRPYLGPAAIVLVPAGTFDSNGYFRSIFFLVRTTNGATLSAGLRKQP